MRLVRFLMLALLLAVMASGCAKTHIDNVPDDRQVVERYINQTGAVLEAARGTADDIFDNALWQYLDGKIDKPTMSKVVNLSRKMDDSLTSAAKAHKSFTKESRAGKSPTRAGLEAAIVIVKDVLKEMEVFE